MRTFKLALVGLVFSPLLHAGELDLSLSDETFSARYGTTMQSQGAGVEVGWLHHVDNGDVVNAGLLVEQSAGNGDSYALGGQVFGIMNDWNDAYAVGLGGRFNVGLPMDPKLRIAGHAWYAPQVTSFDDADHFSDAGIRVGYQALQRGEVYVGYRHTRVGYEADPTVRVADNFQVGMALKF